MEAPLSDTETLLIGLVVTVVVTPSATWQLVQHFQVMAHEGMHGVVWSLSGGKVRGIELKQSAEGKTTIDMPVGRSAFAVTFVGYLGPSAFGLGAARLIQFGHIIAVLWATMLLLGLLPVKLRPSFGYVTVPLAGFLTFLVLKHTSRTAEILAAYAITWFLLLSGVRIVVQRGTEAGDAATLRDNTHIPRLVWFALWLAATLTAVVIGARWMLHPAVRPLSRAESEGPAILMAIGLDLYRGKVQRQGCTKGDLRERPGTSILPVTWAERGNMAVPCFYGSQAPPGSQVIARDIAKQIEGNSPTSSRSASPWPADPAPRNSPADSPGKRPFRSQATSHSI